MRKTGQTNSGGQSVLNDRLYGIMNENDQEPGAIYLPERYKQKVEAKKKRRFMKKIAAVCGVIALCAVLFLVFGGVVSNSLNQGPLLLNGPVTATPESSPVSPRGEPGTLPPQNDTTGENPSTGISEGVPAQPGGTLLSREAATAFLRQDYPASAYSILNVTLTDRYGNGDMYEFRIRKTGSGQQDTGTSAFVNARTGDPYTPGQESAKIGPDQIKSLVKEGFFLLNTDTVRVRYDTGPESLWAWAFSVNRGSTTVLIGTFDPDTGHLLSFNRNVPWEGRPADPLLDISAAQKIADRYIIEKNRGPLPINMSRGQYTPLQVPQKTVAGLYMFEYTRIVQDIPCDNDGFTLSVDAVNGGISAYNRRWNAPDSAFSVAVDPKVTRYEATFSILQKIRTIDPAKVDEITVVSADIRWKDYPQAGSLPRPGSIPMAWKIQFTDQSMRAQQRVAVGWVDVQTGTILDFKYPR